METHVSVLRDETGVMGEESEPPSSGSTRFHGLSGDRYNIAPNIFSPSTESPGFYPRTIGNRMSLKLSPRSRAFMRRFYPGVTAAEWSDWHWQLSHRITCLDGIERIVRLTEDERNAITFNTDHLPLSITPYYASLIDGDNPAQAIRRSVVPVTDEFIRSPGEADDPLGEEADSPVPGIVHRYPDRVLFLVTGFCSTYCRYCTRARMVGKHGPLGFNRPRCEQAIDYIERTPTVRDVLISGGDPLTLSDEILDWLLSRLRRIPHVEISVWGPRCQLCCPSA